VVKAERYCPQFLTKSNQMQVYRINTSAWDEENFYVLTTINKSEIKSVIGPMVKKERDEDFIYDNDDYVYELKKAFPREDIRMYTEIETITF
jgi:tRNA nucleotidyltransferase (CCA-adding enzyme)